MGGVCLSLARDRVFLISSYCYFFVICCFFFGNLYLIL